MLSFNIPHWLSRAGINLSDPRVRQSASLAAANAVASLLKSHFLSLGGNSFWKEAADSVAVSHSGDSIVVSVHKPGVALRRFGGLVRPGRNISPFSGKKTKLLAIGPSLRLSSSAPLKLVPISGKPHLKALLVPAAFATAKKARLSLKAGRPILKQLPGSNPVAFLIDQARHVPNPAVFPSDARLRSVAVAAAKQSIVHSLS